ncbi:MAG: S4 domain-containing protein, partial [Polyangiaceae bacterium]
MGIAERGFGFRAGGALPNAGGARPLGYCPTVPAKRRVDVLLVERELAPTRARAQALILAGKVFSGERRIEKAGVELDLDAELSVRGEERFASRGGHKLEGALLALECDVAGTTCADVGASTGGF